MQTKKILSLCVFFCQAVVLKYFFTGPERGSGALVRAGVVIRAFSSYAVDRGSIPRSIIPKTQKLAFTAFVLNAKHKGIV